MTLAKIEPNIECSRMKDVAYIEIWYPRSESSIPEKQIDTIEIGLMDTRAADNIRVSYDFDRDGWSIKQASKFEWDIDDEICDEGWQEVAFIQAWALEKEHK